MRIDIAMPGLAELDAQLAELGTKIATEIAGQAIKASAELLQEAWARGAPFDAREKRKSWTLKSGEVRSASYGHLYQNIRVRPVVPEKQHAVVYKVTTGDAFWAYFLEFGTVNQRPHPWARPILESMKAACVATQVVYLRAGIEGVARKAASAVGGAPRRKFGPMMANGRNS